MLKNLLDIQMANSITVVEGRSSPNISPEYSKKQVSTKNTKHYNEKSQDHQLKARRLVRFVPLVRVFKVEHRNQMSEEDCRSIWYRRNEVEAIKLNMRITVQKLDAGMAMEENDEFCIRGLEFRTREGQRKKDLRRKGSIAAVLNEQHLQNRDEAGRSLDDMLLAEVYHRKTHVCQQAAHDAALRDELFVKSV